MKTELGLMIVFVGFLPTVHSQVPGKGASRKCQKQYIPAFMPIRLIYDNILNFPIDI